MKKFNRILLIFVCIISICLVGCSYADNATLVSVQEKYSYIARKNEEFFEGSRFIPEYNSEDLNSLINSSDERFNILKTSADFQVFNNRGVYGILIEGINSTYLNNNALTIVNDKNTEKQYKKAMYQSLERLEKNMKNLKATKTSIESVFNNDARDTLIIANQELTSYNLNRYKSSLNKVLRNFYDFNKNYSNALNNNISPEISIDDLLYGNTVITIGYENLNKLVNNLNLLISNYVLSYSIDIQQNIVNGKDILNLMANLLNERYALLSKEINSNSLLADYKVMRALEDALIKNETAFLNACTKLDSKAIKNPSEGEKLAIKVVSNYYNDLVGYANQLIKFLNEI